MLLPHLLRRTLTRRGAIGARSVGRALELYYTKLHWQESREAPQQGDERSQTIFAQTVFALKGSNGVGQRGLWFILGSIHGCVRSLLLLAMVTTLAAVSLSLFSIIKAQKTLALMMIIGIFLDWLITRFVLEDFYMKRRKDTGPPPRNIITPNDRGCQLSLIVPNGRSIYKDLSNRGVVCDWREPDVIRFAPHPLFNSYLDIFHVVAILKEFINGSK